MNTHGMIVDFGKHKGTPWTQVPLSYLKWMINETQGDKLVIAKAEIARRGTVIDVQVELSSHAIDRASLYCRKIWHETRKEGEGLYTWLHRNAIEAREKGTPCGKENDKLLWNDMKFCFKEGNEFPILLTVMRRK